MRANGGLVFTITAATGRFDQFRHPQAGVAAPRTQAVDHAPPSLEGLLGVRGLIEQVSEETSTEEDEARDGAILDCLDEALVALAAVRAEGAAFLVGSLPDDDRFKPLATRPIG